jgi:hypothetical protein
MVVEWENVTEKEILKDERLWVKCDADAMERLCDADIPTDWLTK